MAYMPKLKELQDAGKIELLQAKDFIKYKGFNGYGSGYMEEGAQVMVFRKL
eukprot:CAMPEP_0116879466 /NCGR_PEP_ID=MMETSP0463-20121206/11283_1 /TAXON_ID=181622 /ORGANISM="Strombidinopsis sp, Strain SopsisLIS2011" /LENGTH=50 /DNA_ID=CAMNT_0004528849 /DNA_START=586 /DNA_END=738 /DNA_ORIENTATION=+